MTFLIAYYDRLNISLAMPLIAAENGWTDAQTASNGAMLMGLFYAGFGVANILTSFAIPIFFGDLLLWTPRNLPTELMVGSLYLAMGIIMLLAARDPLRQQAFVDFVILANLFHAIVMLFYAEKPVHILLDVVFIGSMALIPLLLYPWGIKRLLRYR